AKAFLTCAESEWALRDYCAYFSARAMVRHGEASGAFALLDKRPVPAAPLADWWSVLAGEAAFHAQRHETAASQLRDVIERDPDSPAAHRRALLLADAAIAAAKAKPSAAAPGQSLAEVTGLSASEQQRVLTALRAVRRVALKKAGTKLARDAA